MNKLLKRELCVFVLWLLPFLCYCQSKFSNGYQLGYQKGYCYQVFGCIAPIPPISPLPTINESNSSYEDGYQRGFIEGREAKNNNLTPNTSNQYKTRDYGSYIDPFDYSFLYANLKSKQLQYQNEQVRLHKYYSETYQKVSTHSFEYHKKCLEYVKQYQGYYKEAQSHLKQVEFLNPQRLTKNYPSNLSYEQVSSLIESYKQNNKKLSGIVSKVDELIKWYLSSPNKIVNASFQISEIEDYEYNQQAKSYDLVKTGAKNSKVKIGQNFIEYDRSDKRNSFGSALRFEGLKNGAYVFVDGWDNTLALTKDFSILHIYYDRDLTSNQYRKKAIYKGLSQLK